MDEEDLSSSLKEMSMPRQRSRQGNPGLEVYSMWFEKNKIDEETFLDYVFTHRKVKHLKSIDGRFRTIIEKDPAMFQGRIFFSDSYHLHEIYNSKLLDDLYVDLLMEKKLEDCNVSSRHTDLAAPSSPNDAQMQVPERTYLPVMGPHARIHVLTGDFLVILHRDSGKADVDASYEDIAAPVYNKRISLMFDDDVLRNYTGEKSFQLKVAGLYHSLILDCRMFNDSKSVHVEVKWVDENSNASYDDDTAIYICGDLSVISDGRTSLLFKTPPNKAIRVSLGQSIPLLKSVFVVQYYADFEFCANLGCPDNVKADVSLNFPSVKDSVLFPHSESDEAEVYTHRDAAGFNCNLYKTTRLIAGSGGYLKVTATIDIK